MDKSGDKILDIVVDETRCYNDDWPCKHSCVISFASGKMEQALISVFDICQMMRAIGKEVPEHIRDPYPEADDGTPPPWFDDDNEVATRSQVEPTPTF